MLAIKTGQWESGRSIKLTAYILLVFWYICLFPDKSDEISVSVLYNCDAEIVIPAETSEIGRALFYIKKKWRKAYFSLSSPCP